MTSSSDVQHPRIGVGVIILRGKKVLLGRRKGPRSDGFYGLPGGFLENNETFEECAIREVLEETGLENVSLLPIYLISGSSDNIHYADIIFCAVLKIGEPVVKETNRVEKWNWFSIFDLPSPLYTPTKLALNRFALDYKFHKISLFLRRWLGRKNQKLMFIETGNFRKNVD